MAQNRLPIPGRVDRERGAPREVAVRAWVSRYLRPKTVLGLVLGGFLLVGAPLIAGLLVTSQQIGRLTHEGEQSLDQAVGITREARETMDRLRAVERGARQWRVLQDGEAEANFRAVRADFSRQARVMAKLEMPDAPRVTLATLVAREAILADRVMTHPGPDPWPPALGEAFVSLDRLAQSLLAESEAVAEGAVVDLQRLGEQARRLVYVQMASVIPVAIILALVFTGLITRPIRQLDQRIRRLAQPGSRPITPVRGPRDLRVLSVRLEWVRRRLARIEKDRQRLLGQVSHELKTPLSAIAEAVSLLEDELLGPLGERQSEVVAILQANVDRLEQQIQSLLRFNHVRAGLAPQVRRRVSLADLVEESLAAHALTMAARGVGRDIDVESGLAVEGDPDMLRTALENLISNAIKFSPRDARVGLWAREAEGRVWIRVMDNGRGVPASDRHRVFEPFYRGRASAEGAVPGSGLGLSICRDLIRTHGGEIHLTQVAGWRTVFEIVLPGVSDYGETYEAS